MVESFTLYLFLASEQLIYSLYAHLYAIPYFLNIIISISKVEIVPVIDTEEGTDFEAFDLQYNG